MSAPVAAAEPVPMLELSDGVPPPAVRWKTLFIGTAVFGGFYGGALAASYGWSQDPGAEDLRIPLVGPWLKLGHTTLCANLPESSTPCSDPLQVVGGILSVVSGIGQLGGVALMLEGAFMRTGATSSTAVRSERLRLTQPSARRPQHAPQFAVVPVLTPSTLGAFVTGSF